jgi:serine/threonine-protein kinase
MNPKDYEGPCKICGYTGDEPHLAGYLEPGITVGRYIVGKLLSYNGEGATYLAFDGENKVLLREFLPDTLCHREKSGQTVIVNRECAAMYNSYLREFGELNRALIRFEKQYLEQNTGKRRAFRQTADLLEANGTLYAVQEYLDGIDYKSFLSTAGGKLDWMTVSALFAPVLKVMTELEEQGIYHCGVSPSTLFITDDTELILTGYSLPALRQYGTPLEREVFAGYAAPEAYSNLPLGAYTDVYSVAAVMYKSLTAHIPDGADKRLQFDMLTDPSRFASGLPKAVSGVIMRAMAPNPSERYQSIAEFAGCLFQTPATHTNTGELVVKKPVNPAHAAPTVNNRREEISGNRIERDSGGNSRGKSKTRKRRKSYAGVIAVCVMFGIALGGFMFAIFYPALHPELYRTEETTAETDLTTPAAVTTTGAVTSAAQTTPQIYIPTYIIPNFVGMKYVTVQNTPLLQALEVEILFEFSDETQEGVIFEQSVPEGTELEERAVFTLKISNGPPAVPLPDYVDMTIEMYKDLLSESKVKYDTVGEKSETVPAGFVIRASKQPGDMVDIAESEIIVVYYSEGLPDQTTTAPETEIPTVSD